MEYSIEITMDLKIDLNENRGSREYIHTSIREFLVEFERQFGKRAISITVETSSIVWNERK